MGDDERKDASLDHQRSNQLTHLGS